MIMALTFTLCLAGACEPGVMFHRAAGITPERACRMAFEITRARAHPDAVFRDVECKPMEGK